MPTKKLDKLKKNRTEPYTKKWDSRDIVSEDSACAMPQHPEEKHESPSEGIFYYIILGIVINNNQISLD